MVWNEEYEQVINSKIVFLRSMRVFEGNEESVPTCCALSVLECYKQSYEICKSGFTESFTELHSYGLAVIRFINLACEEHCASLPVHIAAREIDIPKWIVDLRHNLVHGYMPSNPQIYLCALEFLVDWILKGNWDHYWSAAKDAFSFRDTYDVSSISKEWEELLKSIFSDTEYCTRLQVFFTNKSKRDFIYNKIMKNVRFFKDKNFFNAIKKIDEMYFLKVIRYVPWFWISFIVHNSIGILNNLKNCTKDVQDSLFTKIINNYKVAFNDTSYLQSELKNLKSELQSHQKVGKDICEVINHILFLINNPCCNSVPINDRKAGIIEKNTFSLIYEVPLGAVLHDKEAKFVRLNNENTSTDKKIVKPKEIKPLKPRKLNIL